MTIAELHGKLSPRKDKGLSDRMEDLLTSDVFGTMKYIGWQYGFMQWLRSAHTPWKPDVAAEEYLPHSEDIRNIHYLFWPKLNRSLRDNFMLCL